MPSNTESAEQRYRAAFLRLKEGTPTVLPRGTPVSQNNVAKEAGTDPSALKLARYPELIADIQAWVEIQDANKAAEREKRAAKRRDREDVNAKLERMTKERDCAQSELVSAHHIILELLQDKAQLEVRIAELSPATSKLRRGE